MYIVFVIETWNDNCLFRVPGGGDARHQESGEKYFLKYLYFKYIKIIFFYFFKFIFILSFYIFGLEKIIITINFYHLWFLHSREINGWHIRFKKVGPCAIFLMKPGRSSVVNGVTKPCASHNPHLPKSNIPLIILNIAKEKNIYHNEI
jgi:hypothetical protein